MDFKLIKQINEQLQGEPEVDPIEKIIAEVNAQYDRNMEEEIERIVDYNAEFFFGTRWSEGQIRARVGDELEQLEYSPEEIQKLVPEITSMIIKRILRQGDRELDRMERDKSDFM